MNLVEEVREILRDVRENGESAVRQYSEKFDSYRGDINPRQKEWEAARRIPEKDKGLIKRAIDRVKNNHLSQKQEGNLKVKDGSLYGITYRPIQRVGLYVPGGTPLPSSLIMMGVPALIAGVPDIVVSTPPNDGSIDSYVLFVADYLGLDEIYKVGGAQAIGAMAYGAGFDSVDKIFGPGNRYVNEAKRQVFGNVGIDGLAGPSEVCIVADESAHPETVMIDLESQLEHGADSRAWLFTTFRDLADYCDRSGVEVEVCPDLGGCMKLANEVAAEHLQILTEDPLELLDEVRNAGAVYLGEYTPTPAADYFLGVNHVLPTGGTAKFSGVLTVGDFMKPVSVAYTGKKDFTNDVDIGGRLAEIEGLEKHKKSMEVRVDAESNE